MLTFSAWASGNDKYEVWAIDQSDSAGGLYGGTIYIWDGHDLEQSRQAAVPEKIDLGGTAAALCLAATGAAPIRPQMIAMNSSYTHAIVSFFASGHVLFLDAATRRPVGCVRVSAGAAGSRSVYSAMPSPDQTYVGVANHHGKLYERILTNYASNYFALDTAAALNLATCRTPDGQPCEMAAVRPDNAAVCAAIDSSSTLNFLTLRGGGLFVIDGKSTPMRILAHYDRTSVHPNGCSGAQAANKMYIGSSGGAPNDPYHADMYAFPLGQNLYSPANGPNLPARRLVFSKDVQGADTQGSALTRFDRYLWVADRGLRSILVVDTQLDAAVNRIELAATEDDGDRERDPGGHYDTATGGRRQSDRDRDDDTDSGAAPALLALSPNGEHMFISLRATKSATADSAMDAAAVDPAGVAVVKITEDGRHGELKSFAVVRRTDAAGIRWADIRALCVRPLAAVTARDSR